MDLENILLSEGNPSRKGTLCVTYVRCLEEANSETEGVIEVRRGWRGRDGELVLPEHRA